MTPDMILLHAPSVYDFREKTILYGPVSDLIPPSPIFEMYPIGLTSIAEYLERKGNNVRIVNLAVRMMRDRKFNVEEMIKRLEAPLFGIDLHWMVHSHGSIEIARLVKKYHPQSKLVFGGLSSSYFYKQLMEYPEIDFVVRGDTTEYPVSLLLDCVKTGKGLEKVPNLIWRDGEGTVRENPFTHVPDNLDDVLVNYYPSMVRSVIRYHDFISTIPFKDWLRYPITAVLLCRGCDENCTICGGSAAAYRSFYNRKKAVFRSPEAIVRDIKQIERFSRGPIFLLGDPCLPGEKYAYKLMWMLQENKVKNRLIMELFNPASKDILEQMSLASPDFCFEMSPESHDPEIRKALGRNYSSEAFEQTLADALDVGCGRLDVFYMIGLPKQTPQSVMDTIDYCGHMMEKFNGDKRLSFFIAPISPFLDPGSLGFEKPGKYGYHVLFRTLEEHRQALVSPSWKYSLNYETDWMTRDQIAETAYEAILRLVHLKAKYQVISKEMAEVGIKRIEEAREMMHRIDTIMEKGNLEEIPLLKAEVDRINAFPVSEKIQLELPVGLVKLRFLNTIWSWISGW